MQGNIKTTALTVLGADISFNVAVGGAEYGDVLGMDFLQAAGVLLNCNYRPEVMAFTLTPTSS